MAELRPLREVQARVIVTLRPTVLLGASPSPPSRPSPTRHIQCHQVTWMSEFVRLDTTDATVRRASERLRLSSKEYESLHCFVQYPLEARQRLVGESWKSRPATPSRTGDAHRRWLRRSAGDAVDSLRCKITACGKGCEFVPAGSFRNWGQCPLVGAVRCSRSPRDCALVSPGFAGRVGTALSRAEFTGLRRAGVGIRGVYNAEKNV